MFYPTWLYWTCIIYPNTIDMKLTQNNVLNNVVVLNLHNMFKHNQNKIAMKLYRTSKIWILWTCLYPTFPIILHNLNNVFQFDKIEHVFMQLNQFNVWTQLNLFHRNYIWIELIQSNVWHNYVWTQLNQFNVCIELVQFLNNLHNIFIQKNYTIKKKLHIIATYFHFISVIIKHFIFIQNKNIFPHIKT